jgi:cytochrome P450
VAAARGLFRTARSALDGYLALAGTYGDAVRIPIGPRSAFFLLSRPEHAEHVLATGQDNYVKAFTYKPLRALIGDGLLTAEGETWRQHRRLVQPLFSRRDVASFAPAMVDAARLMLTGWAELPDGTQIDAAADLSALALDVIGRTLFGADLTGDAERMGRAMAAGQRVAMIAMFLPLPWGPRSQRAVKAAASRLGGTPDGVDGFAARLIAARRAALAAHPAESANTAGGSGGSSPGAGTDLTGRNLIDVLLTEPAADGAPLTDGEIAAEVSTFMLAGHETTANTLSWSLALLSAFPAARARLEDEVDTVLGGRDPDAADAVSLPWTRAVISEALRLYPPAWTVEREAIADDTIAGVGVPAGSLVAVPPYLIHRHPEFWPDPAGFNPERFLAASERPRFGYIPFGGGRRACIGQAFAELETVLVLAAIAQRWRLELPPAGLPRPAAYVTLRPGNGLPMRLTRRGS